MSSGKEQTSQYTALASSPVLSPCWIFKVLRQSCPCHAELNRETKGASRQSGSEGSEGDAQDLGGLGNGMYGSARRAPHVLKVFV